MMQKLVGGLVNVRAHTRRDPPSKKRRKLSYGKIPLRSKRKFIDIVTGPNTTRRVPYHPRRQ